MTELIRLASPADARALARLRWDFRSSHPGLSDREDVIEREDEFIARCEAWMAAALETLSWTCFAAEADGALVGQLWIHLIEKIPNPVVERERHAYITNVFVTPACRGTGIAGRLIERARAWCDEKQVDTMFLWPSDLSRPLYQRHGFFESEAILAAKLDE